MQLRVKIKDGKKIKKLLRLIEGMKADMVTRQQFKDQLDAAKEQIVTDTVAKVGPLVGAPADFTDLSDDLTNLTSSVGQEVLDRINANTSTSTTTATGNGI